MASRASASIVLGVVALGHDDLHQPAQVADRERHRAAEVRLAVVIELEGGLRLTAGCAARWPAASSRSMISAREAPEPRRPISTAPWPVATNTRPRRDTSSSSRAPASRSSEKSTVKTPRTSSRRVEQRRRAGDAEAAARRRTRTARSRRPSRLAAAARKYGRSDGPVAVVVGAAHRFAPAVGEDAILLQPDAVAGTGSCG